MNGIIVSRANRALLAPPIPAVTSMFQGAPALPDGNVLLRHDLANTKLLRSIGFKLPNPMLTYYDWTPGGKPPFEIQKKTCEMLTEFTRSYVLSHMGTGKTKAVLWAWDWLNKNGYTGKLLVVAPLSTLNFTWMNEIFETLPHRKAVVLHGRSKKRRLEALGQDVDIYIINHDGVKTIYDELVIRKDITTLVLDELAVYRNNSDRSKLMRKMAQSFKWVWGMTGAPMPNAPTDVWAQCRIITPWTAPSSRRHAEGMFMERLSQFVLVPKKDAVEKAFAMMQPSVRFSLDDVTELPEGHIQTIQVEATEAQTKAYKAIATALQAMVEEKIINAANAGVAINKLLQIAGGWVYTNNPEFVTVDCAPRVAALLDIIEGVENKVIVFAPFTHMLNGLANIIDTIYPKKFVTVDGNTSREKREEAFFRFQNTENPKILLAHPGTISHGLTLTAADTIVWWVPITSLDIYDQANARIRRVGQKNRQLVVHLQTMPVEKKLYRLLNDKQKLQAQFLSLVAAATASA